jgi:hypothetical protein
MNFELVFDVRDAGYRQWWFPAFGLIFVALFSAKLVYDRKKIFQSQSRWSRMGSYSGVGFAVLWVSISFVMTFSDYWTLRQALRLGKFEVVEGKVADFVPMPEHGHAMEQFNVNGHHYEFSDFSVTAGFNNTRSRGGPIREGMIVRIADVRGKIARLEIAR